MGSLILVLFILVLLCQGGFYASGFLAAGILAAIIFLFQKKQPVWSVELCALVMISIWMILSMVKNNLSYSSLAQALLPMSCLAFACSYLAMDKLNKDRILQGLIWAGLVSSLIGILLFIGVINISGAVNAGRLQFTFQYANVAGTWFAVSFILAKNSDNKWIRYASILNLIPLLMTKSVGAIGTLVLFETIWLVHRLLKKRNIHSYIILCGYGVMFVLAVIVIYSRRGRVISTFAERIVQSYDGLRTMIKHLVTGIGSGNWELLYPYYQSAQYKAAVIHNSYVQGAVDGGCIVLILLLVILFNTAWRYIKSIRSAEQKNNVMLEAAMVILMHSMMDYCLSFLAIDVLLVFLLGYEERPLSDDAFWCKISNLHHRKVVRYGFSAILIMCLCYGFYGNSCRRNLEAAMSAGENNKAVSIFEQGGYMIQNGYAERQLYIQAMYHEGLYENVVDYVEKSKRNTALMEHFMIYAKMYLGEASIDDVIQVVEHQPMNVYVIDKISAQVGDFGYTNNDVISYNSVINRVNKKIKIWPACWLNNQEEADDAN